ncbi:MAG: flagellar hook-basal body complex protein [Gammaproteobacteria bacterium]|nr:flagellar hook-basal body complex protein [Gammaproteobacteria bacterium]
MINSLFIAETGLNAQKTLVDVISNNIANVNTSGFKRSSVNFVDLIYKNDSTGATNSSTTESSRGVHVQNISEDLSVGKLKFTQHPFDVAIDGPGFIPVENGNNGTAYTRLGRLAIDSDGYLQTQQGHRLSANISISPDLSEVVIENNGTVIGRVAGSAETVELGTIELVSFTNASGLEKQDSGIYLATEDSGDVIYGMPGEDGFGNIRQGYTEESNVSLVEEMVNLVMAQRGYQLNARVIQVSDQLLETINNLRR